MVLGKDVVQDKSGPWSGVGRHNVGVFRGPWWPQCYLDELLSGSSGLGSGVEMYTGSPS